MRTCAITVVGVSNPITYVSATRLRSYAMGPDDGLAGQLGPELQCDDCEKALESGGRQAVSFLLLDTLTMPLVGCEAHLEQFRAICELTTEESAELLSHVPAGGVQCPGCRHSNHSMGMPVVLIEAGAVGVLGCSTHAQEVLDRFESGLEIRRQLGADM